MQTKLLASLGILLSFGVNAQSTPAIDPATPPPLPKTMVSIGDSITAGAVASLSRAQLYNPLYLFKLLSTLGEVVFKWSAYGAVQDRHLSWASGLNSNFSVKSHAHRLAYLHSRAGTQIQVGSVSWSGDTSYDLEVQVDRALEWNKTRSADGGPDYVTILIGANDICADDVKDMSEDREFYNNVNTAISRLIEANPNAHVVISSLPDVNTLNSVARNSRLMGVYPYAKCEDFWRKVNLCRTLTRMPEGSLDRYLVGEKVLAYNRILRDIATETNAHTGMQNVKYAPTTYTKAFTDKDISVDCFHPNQKGQNILADATWNDGFWAKGWSDKDFDKHIKKVKRERAKKHHPLGPPHHR
ncbi:MAG TPA: SGNH/GDSL hydrolase family protein [Bdellovibrionota bacterium]|jgi:lysophospholipase L1-like esterase|nr:SGNH/GDSL hydrolase family protein [Bdellovibrionota bacterium]